MPAPPETPYLRPAFLTALLAALISLAVSGIFVVLAGGFVDASVTGVARGAARTWLVSIGAGLDAGPVSIGLVPIGASVLCVGVVAAVAALIAADPIDDVLAFAATAAGALGVIAAMVSTVSESGDVHTSVVRAAAGGFLVGGLGAALGTSGRHGGSERWWFTRSADVRAAVRGSVPAVLAVLLASTVIVVVLMVTHLSRAGDLWALLDPGMGGGVALGAGSLLAIPTLILWTTSALLGPGFVLGTDTSVDLTGSQLGAVPGFPLLAALPSPGAFPDVVFLLGLVPVLAGMLAGWRVDPGEREGPLPRVLLGAAAGGVAGLVLGALVGMSGGAIGPGRMADAGPPLLTPLLVAVPIMAAGGALGGALSHYRGSRASRAPGLPDIPDVPRDSEPGEARRPRLWRRNQPAGTDRRIDES